MNRLFAISSFMCVILVVSGQRAPFAGSRPNGYKDKLQTDNTISTSSDANTNVIVDRFGGSTNTGGVAVTTDRLPHLALGDREIVDRFNTFPVDQRPFWLVNAEAIEAQKNQGRPSTPTNQNVGEIGNRFGSGGQPNTVNGNRPNYPSVVYPLEMTPDQRVQTQQMFNNQIQQTVANNNNVRVNSNPSPSRIVIQKPVAAQQTINNGPKQIPQPVQGRFPNSGYNG
ncbi:uncharacterized protein LOC119071010 [Bradysia coprophila]|uniref:uncharacterized protein LOC119071010 n=1 Tax=Bradysia coprophila TaxID=38358 RepID=UPI00187D7960|nr:uncharacterized protein LOC119071010 [Bradysia coprophila]